MRRPDGTTTPTLGRPIRYATDAARVEARRRLLAARHAAERADCQWKKQGSQRAENAWPTGPHRRPCLKCDRAFLSTAKDHRLCGDCGGSA